MGSALGSAHLQIVASAFSGHLWGNKKRCEVRTTEVRIHPLPQLSGCPQPGGCDHGPFAMDPLRLHGVEPWTFDGQGARHKGETVALTVALLVVLSAPLPPGVAAVPRGILPHQQPRC